MKKITDLGENTEILVRDFWTRKIEQVIVKRFSENRKYIKIGYRSRYGDTFYKWHKTKHIKLLSVI